MRRLGVVLAMVACSQGEPAPESTSPALGTPGNRPDLAMLKLDVTSVGTTMIWRAAEFGKVPRMAGTASDAEARDAWSLRELVRRLAGPKARLGVIVGTEHSKVIDPA